MIQIAISSWTVHGLLGQVWYEPDKTGAMVNKNPGHVATLELLDLPAYMAKDGIYVLELCNFHLPSIEDGYLAQLKEAFQQSNITLANLLIDTGNLSSLDDTQWRADLEQTQRWQDVASQLGALGVRIDCGTERPTPQTRSRSASALRELADYGESIGLTTTTENWRTTSVYPADLFDILKQVDRPLKLCVDFGNAEKTPDKYATLQTLLPHANSLHCKGHFVDGVLDEKEFHHSLNLVKAVDFSGHISLIHDGIDGEWARVLTLKEHVETQLM